MPQRVQTSFKIEGAELIFRNFSGTGSQFNKEGDRNFCTLLDEDTARKLKRDGWNVKRLKPREDEEGDTPEGTPYIQIMVGYKFKPPRIILLTSGGRTFLTEETVDMLDGVDIENADLIANPYNWTVGDKSGVKPYLKTMYVTLNEDDLDRKYAGIGEHH